LADFILLPTRCSIIDIGTMGAPRDICQLARARPAAVVINAAPIPPASYRKPRTS